MQLTKKTERGSDLNTKEYRKLSNISYSDIKLFLTDRKMFFRKKIIGEEIAEKPTLSKTIGNLVHCKLLEPQNWDKLFCISGVTVSGQMGTLAENLYARTLKYMDPDTKELTVSFNEIMEMAINDTRYNGKGEEVAFKKKTFEWILDQFSGSDSEIYYREMRNNHGKTVINPYNDEQAQQICNEALANPWTRQWITDDNGWESHNELPVIFEHMGVQVKSLIDRIMIDHDNKVIYNVDIKSLWDNENFERNYTSLYYYIQAALYDLSAKAWAEQLGIGDYTVTPMRFVCVDSQGYMKSLVYTLTAEDIENAYEGFRIHGRLYPGLKTAITALQYAIDNNVWNTTRQAIESEGNMGLQIEYDK